MQLHILFLLAFLGTALAYPSLSLDLRASKGSAAKGSKNSTCNATENAKLMDGLQRNIDIQMKELQSLQTLQYLATTAPTILKAANSTSGRDPIFSIQQTMVEKLQQESIDVRTQNQKMAQMLKSPTSLQKSLASVANEQNMAKGTLKGLVAGKNDTAAIQSVVKGTQSGMKMNMESLKVAKTGMGCGK